MPITGTERILFTCVIFPIASITATSSVHNVTGAKLRGQHNATAQRAPQETPCLMTTSAVQKIWCCMDTGSKAIPVEHSTKELHPEDAKDGFHKHEQQRHVENGRHAADDQGHEILHAL